MFRVWRAKAQMHEEEMRPMEAGDQVIDSRTLSFWNALETRKRTRQTSTKRQLYPNLLLEPESEARARVLQELEKMDEA